MPQRTLDERTSLPFKIVVPIVTTLLICVWTVSAKLTTIENNLKLMWSAQDMERWTAKLQHQNQELIVPDVVSRP